MAGIKASLYIHIPFCSSKCDYCDFFSVTIKENDSLIDEFINAVAEDVNYQIKYFDIKEIPTVYIGGGTPSALGEKIDILLNALKKNQKISPVEFTIEANPESVTEEFLLLCKKGGINRLSLGVQTFHEPSRLSVNRGKSICGSTWIEDKLNIVSQYFPNAFSVDLITGLPFQDEKIILNDIEKILKYNAAHVSFYSLSAEENTPLIEKIQKKTVMLPDSHCADNLWLFGRQMLLEHGFKHYEISNFARFEKQCLHNKRYWQMQNWIGAGPSASGTLVNEQNATAKRFTYSKNIGEYIKKPFIHKAICENIDSTALLKESLLMGFRCEGGPEANIFKNRFGLTIEECIGFTIKKWKGRDKMLFLNSFLAEAFKEAESKYN